MQPRIVVERLVQQAIEGYHTHHSGGVRQTVSARMTTDDEKHSKWVNLYRLAYLERDPVKLVERIAEAEQAMHRRQKEPEVERSYQRP